MVLSFGLSIMQEQKHDCKAFFLKCFLQGSYCQVDVTGQRSRGGVRYEGLANKQTPTPRVRRIAASTFGGLGSIPLVRWDRSACDTTSQVHRTVGGKGGDKLLPVGVVARVSQLIKCDGRPHWKKTGIFDASRSTLRQAKRGPVWSFGMQ